MELNSCNFQIAKHSWGGIGLQPVCGLCRAMVMFYESVMETNGCGATAGQSGLLKYGASGENRTHTFTRKTGF
jgi:hypothetical protein